MDTISAPGITPETLRVKQEILRHRAALNDVQNDTIKAISPSKAVSFTSTPSMMTRPDSAKSVEEEDAVMDLIMYKDSALTFLVVLLGGLGLSAGHYVLSGHGMPIFSAISYTLLGKLSYNFLCSLFSLDGTGPNLTGSSSVKTVAKFALAGINFAAQLHDDFLNSKNPKKTLKVACGLWSLAIIGQFMSFWTVVTVTFILAFTAPVTYSNHKDTLHAMYRQASKSVKSRWAALKLTRKQQASVLAFGLIVLWMKSSWSTRLLGALIGALSVRCNLKPSEIVALRQRAEPYTSAVKKKASRMSIAATDFAYRTLGATKRQD